MAVVAAAAVVVNEALGLFTAKLPSYNDTTSVCAAAAGAGIVNE